MSSQTTQKVSAEGIKNQTEDSQGQETNKLVVGILAHVDAGKTTLSEGILYTSGRLKSLGRVDNGDAYLDTDAMERERGITIFSAGDRLRADERRSRRSGAGREEV